MLGVLGPALLIGLVARLVLRRLVRDRRQGWILELAIEHRVPPDALRAALVG